MIHIYLDAMGGDNAPKCTVEGALEARRADQELKITLGGPRKEIEETLSQIKKLKEAADKEKAKAAKQAKKKPAAQKPAPKKPAAGAKPAANKDPEGTVRQK